MCMTCGCALPNDNHGDPRNITQQSLNQAAQAAGISLQQAAQNFMNACQQLNFTPEASYTEPTTQRGDLPVPEAGP